MEIMTTPATTPASTTATTTATYKALRIPEIVHAIVSFLWRYHSDLQCPLCPLILVCKDLHRICTPLLWHNLSLQGGAFQASRAFPFSVPSKHSLLEQESGLSARRQLLVVLWFKKGLRKYGHLVRSIDWHDLREGKHSDRFPTRASEDVRMVLKRNRLLSQEVTRSAKGATENVGTGGEVLPGDLPAYNFDEDTDDDDMEDRLLNSKELPKDDGGVRLRTWVLKFCPNLERVRISHLSAGMDIYRSFFVEAAKRTMLSSITILVVDRGRNFSYSGGTLADFFESITGIMNDSNSAKVEVNKLPSDTDIATALFRDNVLSKGVMETRSGGLLDLSIRDETCYAGGKGGYEHADKLPWFLLTRLLDTHPNLRSLMLFNLMFVGNFAPTSSYPAMRQVRVSFDFFKDRDLSPFLSLFPNLEILNIEIFHMSLKTILTLLHQHCPFLSDLTLRPTSIDEDESQCLTSFFNEFQHSMRHLKSLSLIQNFLKYHWERPNDFW